MEKNNETDALTIFLAYIAWGSIALSIFGVGMGIVDVTDAKYYLLEFLMMGVFGVLVLVYVIWRINPEYFKSFMCKS